MSVIEAEALFQARSQYLFPVRPAREEPGVRAIHIKALLDALPHATAIFDTSTRQLYSNHRLMQQLQYEPQAQIVLNALRDLGRAVATCRTEQIAQIKTKAYTYRADAAYLQLPLIGSGDTVLISVQPAGAALPTTEELRIQFALTDQEARITLLLAERVTTTEIAVLLDISKNTVRRHVERVLAKLQIGTRSDIRARIVS